jgi:KDO2-lipid IV(A) lauroyltransferase
MGRLVYALDSRHRRRTVEHLRMGLGGALAKGQAEALARGVFDTVARHAAEFLRRGRSPIRLENVEILRRAREGGKGVVAVSAHLGSFSLLGRVARELGVPSAVVLKRQKNRHLLGWIRGEIERRFGVEVVLKPEAARDCPEALRRGRVLVLFADQHPISGGVPARFFGRPVEAAAGPAVFARRYGCPLIVVTVHDAAGGHVVRFDGPVSTEGSIGAISQGWLDLLEARIREHPDEWVWTHRRWREPGGAGERQV